VRAVNVYDYVALSTIEPNDQIVITNEEGGEDPIEVTKVIDSGDSIWVKGYSHLTGDHVDYCRSADEEVGLWEA
jgi:hypothetical protein